MKVAACAVILGLWFGGTLRAQELRRWIPPGFVGPEYHLQVTPLDWKFESKTGMSSHKVEEQVGMRLLEGLGWKPRFDERQRAQVQRPEGNVRVELDIKEGKTDIKEGKRQRLFYTFRVVVDTPQGWPPVPRPRAGLTAWHWEKGGAGVSKRGDYPREFRQALDLVLRELINDWRARFE